MLDPRPQWRQEDRLVVRRVAQEVMGAEVVVVRVEVEEVPVAEVTMAMVTVGEVVKMQVGMGPVDRNVAAIGVSRPRRGLRPPPRKRWGSGGWQRRWRR